MVDELKVLSSDTRLKILNELNDRPTTASFLSKILNKHITTVSEHLEKLEQAGLIERKRRNEGKFVFYNLTTKGKRIIEPTLNIKLVLSGAILSVLLISYVGLLYLNQSRMLAEAPLPESVGEGYGTAFNFNQFLLFMIPVFIGIFILGIIIGRKLVRKRIPEY